MTEYDLFEYENMLYDSGISLICGVDEVGRGSLAGPVLCAAVIMDQVNIVHGVNDSKKLSKKKREELYKEITKKAIAISTFMIFEDEIDKINIYSATKKCMFEAVKNLKVKPQHVLIDAMRLPELDIESTSIIKGDAKSYSIACASIVAKVLRDEYMDLMDFKFPNYGFKSHKGYCTKKHIEALNLYGPCLIHRKTFYPVSKFYNKQVQLQFDFDS